MTAALDLLDLAQRYGIEMIPAGERIRLRAPVRPPAEVLEQLRAHKPEVIAALDARLARQWGDAAAAVAWFLRSEPRSKPFVLRRNAVGLPSITVLHPAWYWRALRADVAAGPGRGRDGYGAVGADVLRLYEHFGDGA